MDNDRIKRIAITSVEMYAHIALSHRLMAWLLLSTGSVGHDRSSGLLPGTVTNPETVPTLPKHLMELFVPDILTEEEVRQAMCRGADEFILKCEPIKPREWTHS